MYGKIKWFYEKHLKVPNELKIIIFIGLIKLTLSIT